MRIVLLLVMVLGLAMAQGSFESRFEGGWRLVKERYYDPTYRGLNWDQVGDKYRARLGEVKDEAGLYRLLDEMIGELGDDHSRFLSPTQARRYLSGAQCLPAPVPTEPDKATEPAKATEPQTKPADSKSPPPSSPPAKSESKDQPAELPISTPAFEASKATLRGDVVLLRLSNLVEADGMGILEDAIRRYDASAKGYVLDLRGNPGGLALRMAQVAGIFMRGIPWRIVTRGFGVSPQPTLPLPFGRPLTSKPLVVLIDGAVNSAAEGLAGALKDSKRAYLIGEKTAGNTEVLIPYCFPDGAVVLLASGVLAPFSGPTWEGRGVLPDLEVKGSAAQLDAAVKYIRSR
jgi:carboxyl-terminal processing protease